MDTTGRTRSNASHDKHQFLINFLPMTLTGITWDHPRGYSPLAASSLLYQRLTGISVEWKIRSLGQFGDQSLLELAESFDLLVIDHPHTGIAWETRCLHPLDEILPAELLVELRNQATGPSFSSYQYKEKQWAIPVDAAVQCASYRADLMETFAIPRDWNEVFDLAEGLKKINRHVGMALCSTDCLCSFMSITAQLGSPVTDGNERFVDRVVGLESLEIMRKMRDCFHRDSLHWNPVQLYDHMSSTDEIAYAPLAFCYSNYSRPGFSKNKLSYAKPPGGVSAILGGAGMAVSSKTKHLRQAAHYAAWLGSAKIQKTVYLISEGQPANIVAWRSEKANRLTGNFFFNLMDTITHAYVRPRYSGWPAFQRHLGEVLHGFLQSDGNPQNVLDQLQEAYYFSYKTTKAKP